MRFSNIKNVAMAAAVMAALPVATTTAQAQSAQSLSVASGARASADAQGEQNQLFEGGFILPVIIVVAVGLGLYFALDDGDDSTSP